MKETKLRPGVMVYFHLFDMLKLLDTRQVGEMMLALMDYAQTGAEPCFSEQVMQVVWISMKNASDLDRAHYEMKRQRAIKGANKRWHEEAMLNDAYDARNSHNTETTAATATSADADASTTASASAKPQTKKQGPQSFEVPFHAGEDFQAWRERQIQAITEYNRNLRAEAKEKKQTAG